MAKIIAYLINLDDSTERLATATAHLQDRGIPFTRIPAVDGRKANPTDFPAYDDAASQRHMGRGVMGGELGCFYSHLACAQALLQSDANYALVFEDDVTALPDLMPVLRQALDWLEQSPYRSWRLINLGNPALKLAKPLTTFTAQGGPYTLCRADYFPMSAITLCWSRKGAAEFIAFSQHIFAPYDNMLQYWLCRSGGGLSFSPPLSRITGVVSDIEWQSPDKNRRRKFARSRSYGLRKQRRLWGNKFWAIWRKASGWRT